MKLEPSEILMNQESINFAPGARIAVRDAEWLVHRVDRTSTGGQALNVIVNPNRDLNDEIRDVSLKTVCELSKSLAELEEILIEIPTILNGK